MFSFNRNASRQSSNPSTLNINKSGTTRPQAPPALQGQVAGSVKSNPGPTPSGGPLPKSARHSQQPTQVSFDYVAAQQSKNKALQQQVKPTPQPLPSQTKMPSTQVRNLS
jgi:hypothetical protein